MVRVAFARERRLPSKIHEDKLDVNQTARSYTTSWFPVQRSCKRRNWRMPKGVFNKSQSICDLEGTTMLLWAIGSKLVVLHILERCMAS
jgi:hypothetical protein